LRERYQNEVFYTKSGARTLVFVNPCKDLSGVGEAVESYVQDYKDSSGQRTLLPPHIFQNASNAYFHMRRSGQDQAIILHGESGSGKTENSTLLTKQFLALSLHRKKESKLQTQVLHRDVILEAFGNARTSANRNASRFGKFTELQFNERGRLIGAKTLHYFLEKSRVSKPRDDERNFHVFYYLLAGASPEERAHLQLVDSNSYSYLGRLASTSDDSAKFLDLKKALKTLSFPKKDIAQTFQLIAALLHLGNLQFLDDPARQQDAAYVKNPEVLDLVGDFLGVAPHALETALTYRTKLIKKRIMLRLLKC